MRWCLFAFVLLAKFGVAYHSYGQEATGQARGKAVPLEQLAVWTAGADGYHTYRIPSLLVTTKGTVVAFAEGRRKGTSDTGDIDLLMKRSDDGGKTWSKQSMVWDEGPNTCGNPCPVVDRFT